MPSFNLVERPWLPCVTTDGAAVEISLRQALLQAHNYRELFDPSPLVTVSLHRLLLAVLHRAYMGPPGIAEWRDIWNAGRFDPERIGAYLDSWQHRFDLFDAERPFYQVPFIADLVDAKEQKPVSTLVQEAASGNNVTLFHHSVNSNPLPMPAAMAARCVVAVQAFAIGGGVSKPFNFSHGPMTRGYSLLAVGDTLFETLNLNLLPYNRDSPIPQSRNRDIPSWEHDDDVIPISSGSTPDGYLDYLTWQSRQIHLIPESDSSVIRCQIRQRMKLEDDTTTDPFKSYRVSKETGRRPQSFQPQRALWRDSSVLLAQMGSAAPGEGLEGSDLVRWLARIEGDRRAGRIRAKPIYRLSAAGISMDPRKAASVVLWRREELPLPLALLDTPNAISPIRIALNAAEEASRALNRGARQLAELLLAPASDEQGARKPDADKAVKPLVRALAMEQRFWPRLEEPFARFLKELPDDPHPDPDDPTEIDYGLTILPIWADAVRATARDAFTDATASLDRSARSLKAVARAHGTFERSLKEALRYLDGTGAEEKGGEAA